MAQGLNQLGIILAPLGVQPLLELIEHDHHFRFGQSALSATEGRHRLFEIEVLRQRWAALAQAVQQAGFRLVGRRLDRYGQDVPGQSRQESGLDQRRLAAARRAINQTDTKRLFGIGLLDPLLPEVNALGESVPVARTRQEFQEKIGVVGIERPQPFGHDLDRAAAGRQSCRDRCRRGNPLHPRHRCVDRLRLGREVAEIVPQIVGQVFGRGEAIRGPLGERLETDSLEFLRNRVVNLPRRLGLDVRDLKHRTGPIRRAERIESGQQLVQNDAQAEHVRTAVDEMPLAAGLFRAHVGRRADEFIVRAFAEVLVLERDAEVGHVGPLVIVDQNVLGLDVAMDEALGVRIVQGFGDRRHDFGRLDERQRMLLNPPSQIGPFDELGDHITQTVVGAADVEHRHDGRMIEARQNAGLVQIFIRID